MTFGVAHDLSIRERAGQIGIPFTLGMRITLAEGLAVFGEIGIRYPEHSSGMIVGCYIGPSREPPYHGAATGNVKTSPGAIFDRERA